MTPPDHYFSSEPNSEYAIKIIRTISRNRPYEFLTAPGVFSANKVDTGTSVLLKKVSIPEQGKILDLGCGIGVVGIVISSEQHNLKTHFIDINSRATELTLKNIKKYKLRNTSVFTGDYMKILEENKFLYDAIYFNPPIRLGKKTYLPHIHKAAEFLTTGGVMQIVIKKKLGAESAYNSLYADLDEEKYTMKILGKNSGYWVFEIRKLE
ncbi:MAG: class I SAM-dependent methyltransferase [Promethearchaeota archaeon]